MDKITRLLGLLCSGLGIFLVLFGGIKTAENFRILSDIIQNLFGFLFMIFLFRPNENQIKRASLLGIFVLIFDFFLETIAVKLDWWYPMGGIQAPPLLIIPLEMVLSFFLIGASFSFILDIPDYVKTNFPSFSSKPPIQNILDSAFSGPAINTFWRILFLFINAIIGTHGDYGAGESIWKPGAYWQPIYTFIVWFGGGLLTLAVYTLIKRNYFKNSSKQTI